MYLVNSSYVPPLLELLVDEPLQGFTTKPSAGQSMELPRSQKHIEIPLHLQRPRDGGPRGSWHSFGEKHLFEKVKRSRCLPADLAAVSHRTVPSRTLPALPPPKKELAQVQWVVILIRRSSRAILRWCPVGRKRRWGLPLGALHARVTRMRITMPSQNLRMWSRMLLQTRV